MKYTEGSLDEKMLEEMAGVAERYNTRLMIERYPQPLVYPHIPLVACGSLSPGPSRLRPTPHKRGKDLSSHSATAGATSSKCGPVRKKSKGCTA